MLTERISTQVTDQLVRTTAQRHNQCRDCSRVLLVGSPCYVVNDPKKEVYLCISCGQQALQPWPIRLSQGERSVFVRGICYAMNRQLTLVVYSTGAQTLARLFVATPCNNITLIVNDHAEPWLRSATPLMTGQVNRIKLLWSGGEKEFTIPL